MKKRCKIYSKILKKISEKKLKQIIEDFTKYPQIWLYND